MNRFHRGTSLIELIVTMGVGSSIMMIAIGWIHQSMTLSSAVRQRQSQHQNLLLWSRLFRDDIRTSHTVQQPSENELVLSDGEGLTIRYRIETDGLRREVKSSNGNEISERLMISDPSLITLEVNPEIPTQVEWIIRRSLPIVNYGSQPSPLRVDLAITATVGAGLGDGVQLVREVSP